MFYIILDNGACVYVRLSLTVQQFKGALLSVSGFSVSEFEVTTAQLSTLTLLNKPGKISRQFRHTNAHHK